MKTFEIFFSDLNEKAQKRLLDFVGETDPKEMNWDADLVPLSSFDFEEEAETSAPTKETIKETTEFTLDDIFRALYIVSDIAPVFIEKEYLEEALPNSDNPIEALAWIIGNCYKETGYIHFNEEPPIVGG